MTALSRLLLAFVVWWLLTPAALSAVEKEQPVPSLKSRVTDLTNTLSSSQQAQIEQMLQAFEQRRGSQIAVLLVPTTKPETIEQYSLRVVEQWKLGRKGMDDGVLLLIAKQDRRVRIEVGYGLEGILPDARAKQIISNTLTPRFKRGAFYEGIQAGIQQILEAVEQEPTATTKPARKDAPQGVTDSRVWIAPLILPIFSILFPLGLLLAMAVSIWRESRTPIRGASTRRRSRQNDDDDRSSSWSSGGWSGGGFGGGGGGFSGGGGSFGGGGASGSW